MGTVSTVTLTDGDIRRIGAMSLHALDAVEGRGPGTDPAEVEEGSPEDLVRTAAQEALDKGPEYLEKRGFGGALEALAGILADCPRRYWSADLLGDLEGCDVADIVARVVRLPERSHLSGRTIDVVWRRRHATRQGQVVLGKAGPTPRKDRDLGAGDFRVELAFDAWCLLTPEERERLVHHELGHCRVADGLPAGHGHDVEEHADTVARYGLARPAHGQLVAEAMAHPTTAKRLREWGFDPATGQGLLFGAGAA